MARQGRVGNGGKRNGIGSMKGPHMSQGITKYVLIFIDDFVIKMFFYTVNTKFVAFDKFKVFKTWWKIGLKKKIKLIKCDGGEYDFKNFNVIKG
jgi:hypothetical protein